MRGGERELRGVAKGERITSIHRVKCSLLPTHTHTPTQLKKKCSPFFLFESQNQKRQGDEFKSFRGSKYYYYFFFF